jgi:hypothetical protein
MGSTGPVTERSAEWRAGYEAAVAELEATVVHWRAFRVREAFLDGLVSIADCIRHGWECAEESHTAAECLARRPT